MPGSSRMPKLHYTTDVCLLRNLFTLSTFLVVLYLSNHPFRSILTSAVVRFFLMVIWFAVEAAALPDVTRWLACLIGLKDVHDLWRGQYTHRGFLRTPTAKVSCEHQKAP
mmetsp:Transcript_7533/g.18302  ORF Transcript_7533/g.18302 Transcript_7533/m.18302 type:complete len:110 (+) Transcript_7533:1-330(+)